MIKTLKDFHFEGLTALVRVDFNVPLDAHLNIQDTTRIDAALPTIEKILNDGGSVVLLSHMGRPKGKAIASLSLKSIVPYLEGSLGEDVLFFGDLSLEETAERIPELDPGFVMVVENTRFHPEEKAGDKKYAEALSKLGDIYVNDAFGAAHRAHASTAVVADFFQGRRCMGNLLEKEIEQLDKVVHQPNGIKTAVIGGSKVSSKFTLLQSLAEKKKVDNIIVGGAMAYTFALAQGGKVGKSLVEPEFVESVSSVMQKAKENGVRIVLPTDSYNGDEFSETAQCELTDMGAVTDGHIGLDIGPESCALFHEVISSSDTIVWNGPMGKFEWDAFSLGTQSIGASIAEATDAGAFSIVGGGDSVSAAKQFGIASQMSYISTGGGAMLEYLEGKMLPGIQALEENN